MTKKRFTLEETHLTYRIRDNGAIMKIPKIVDLLNDLDEENTQLKKQIKEMQIRFKRKYDYEFDEIVDELE